MMRWTLSLLVVLGPCGAASAVNVFVNATGGSDSRTYAQAQSESTPWLTISKFLGDANVVSGDVCYVKTGSYPETAYGYVAVAAGVNNKTLVVEGYDQIPGDLNGAVNVACAGALWCVFVDSANNSGGDLTFRNIQFKSTGLNAGKAQVDHRGVCVLRFDRCIIGYTGGGNAAGAIICQSAATTGKIICTNTTLQGMGNTVLVSSGSFGGLAFSSQCSFAPTPASYHSFNLAVCTVPFIEASDSIFAVTGTNSRAFICTTGSTGINLIVRNNQFSITGSGAEAINLQYSMPNVLLDGNEITISHATTAGIGIRVGMDANTNANPLGNVIVRNNTVRYTGADNTHGILMGEGTDYGVCEGNIVDGADIGIVVKSEGCLVAKNRVSGPRGIYVKGGQYNRITRNTINVTSYGAIHWSNADSHDNPIRNVWLNNICKATGSGYSVYNNEDVATNEGHFDNYLDGNVYDHPADQIAYLDGAAIAGTGSAALTALRAKWTGTWTNGGAYTFANVSDLNSVSVDVAVTFLSTDPTNANFLRTASPAAWGTLGSLWNTKGAFGQKRKGVMVSD